MIAFVRSVRGLVLMSLGGFALGAAVLVAALSLTGRGVGTSPVVAPVTIHSNAYPIAASPEEAVYMSDAGIRGTIVSIGDARVATLDGQPLKAAEGGVAPQPFSIYRRVTVRVAESFSGNAPAEVSIAVVGGSMDGVYLDDDNGMSGIKTGDAIIAFVEKPPKDTKLEPDDWVLVEGFTIAGSEAHNPWVPAMTVTDLIARARAEAARRAAGASDPAR